jgi:hypothetical protein
VGGERVKTQRCNLPSPTFCVFVAYVRSRSGRSSIAPFPMQNIVAKTTKQRTIARADVSLVLTLTAISCSLFISSRLLGGMTGVGDPVGDEVASVDELVGAYAGEFDACRTTAGDAWFGQL